MKINKALIVFLGVALFSGKQHIQAQTKTTEKENIQTFQNKGHELVYNMVQKVGTYNDLLKKKDVVYTYTYITPDGKKDVSTEKYIFNGELSYGEYKEHGRVFADLKGTVEQSYDGSEYWLKHNGTLVNDAKKLKRVAFNRPTNFYWFAMFQKLLDPQLTYEYVGEKTIESKLYDVVKVGFTSDKPSDIYQIYINKETNLVDQFLFTVADFNVMDTPRIMRVEYEKIDDMLIPTKRLYKPSTWEADASKGEWISVNWTNIKFNNNLSPDDFKK